MAYTGNSVSSILFTLAAEVVAAGFAAQAHRGGTRTAGGISKSTQHGGVIRPHAVRIRRNATAANETAVKAVAHHVARLTANEVWQRAGEQ